MPRSRKNTKSGLPKDPAKNFKVLKAKNDEMIKKAVESSMKEGDVDIGTLNLSYSPLEVGFVEVDIGIKNFGNGARVALRIPCQPGEEPEAFAKAWDLCENQLGPKLKEVAQVAKKYKV